MRAARMAILALKFGEQMSLELMVAMALMIGALCVLLFVIYHKMTLAIDRLSKEIPGITGNVITQLEALSALQTELKFNHALPPTRGWAASPDFLRNLMNHMMEARPAHIVECSSGISTVILARCAQLQGLGHVYSLEHDPKFSEKTRRLLRQHGLADFATVLDAPLKSLSLPGWSGDWYSCDVLPPGLMIDLLVIDGPPWFVGERPRYPAIPALYSKLNSNAVIFLDDAARPEEEWCVARWIETFPDLKLLDVWKCEKGCIALIKPLIKR